MESTIKVKFTAIEYSTGNKISFNKNIKSDEKFEDKEMPEVIINNGLFILPKYTKKAIEFADEWLENQSNILYNIIHDPKRELQCIINWEILSVNGKSNNLPALKITETQRFDLVFEGIKQETGEIYDDKFKADFNAVYNEMKDSLKGLSLTKKMQIIFASMGVAYISSTTAYQRMIDLMSCENSQEMRKLIDKNREPNKQLNQ